MSTTVPLASAGLAAPSVSDENKDKDAMDVDAGADADGNQLQMFVPPINIDRLCSLLKEHQTGAGGCEGGNCAMLFGNIGAGKSTLLHLFAGAEFKCQAVEVVFLVHLYIHMYYIHIVHITYYIHTSTRPIA